jgi:hypothetical protein
MGEGGFLGRWARRKAEARREDQPAAPNAAITGAAEPRSPDAPLGEGGNAIVAPDPTEPFDLSQLPDIATLGADSDFTPFLRAGVPTSLRTEALRRLWVSDPAIVNYKTFADYDWDFNAPGYGKLLPFDDVKRLVEAAIGELRADDPPKLDADRSARASAEASALPPTAPQAAPPQPAPPEPAPPEPIPPDPAAPVVVAQRPAPPPSADMPALGIAPNPLRLADPVPAPRPRRRHGGAVPD